MRDEGSPGFRVPVRWVGVVLLIGLILIVVVQNTEPVGVKLLFWDFTATKVLLIVFPALFAFLAGYLVARIAERRRSRNG